MALILTFLGKGGTGRSTIAIATAKKYAAQGKRVLLLSQDPGPGLGILLGTPLTSTPQEIAPNFKAVQVQSAPMLERRWDEVNDKWMYLITAVSAVFVILNAVICHSECSYLSF